MLMIMIELVIMMITTVIIIFFLNETVLARAAAGFGFQPGQT